jgi:ribosomal protein S19E (S16A)
MLVTIKLYDDFVKELAERLKRTWIKKQSHDKASMKMQNQRKRMPCKMIWIYLALEALLLGAGQNWMSSKGSKE